jgi:hypothetical protein
MFISLYLWAILSRPSLQTLFRYKESIRSSYCTKSKRARGKQIVQRILEAKRTGHTQFNT